MKCDDCARLRHRIKRADAKPKPMRNAAAPSFGSIQTANSDRTEHRGGACVAHRPLACVPHAGAPAFFVLWQKALGFALADDSETKIIAGEIWDFGAARGRAQTGEARFPTATAINAFGCAGRSMWIGFGRCLVLLQDIAAPLPDISRHIFDPKRAGSSGKRTHRRTLRITIVNLAIAPGEGSVFVGEIGEITALIEVAPRVSPPVTPFGAIFPFRFRRQPIFSALTGTKPL